MKQFIFIIINARIWSKLTKNSLSEINFFAAASTPFCTMHLMIAIQEEMQPRKF
jgi:hypothetical protein